VKKNFRIVSVLMTFILLMTVLMMPVAASGQRNGESVNQIKVVVGFEDTTKQIMPRPSSIEWEESDRFAADIIWASQSNTAQNNATVNEYRFSGRSPLAFNFLSLSWRAYDLVTGMPTEVAPESFEVWYRSSYDGVLFGEWFQTKGDFKREDNYYTAPFFALSAPNGQTHRYFEVRVHVPPSTRLGEVNLAVSDTTTNTVIKHGLMTDAAIKSAIENGMISVEALEPAVKSDLHKRGVIPKDNLFIHDNRVETVQPSGTDGDIMGANNIANPTSSPPRPIILTRAQWWGNLDPGELNSPRWAPVYGSISHAIIHHTAGPNNPADPLSVVRNIWIDHAQTRGWGDIGYNFLIDHLGNIYHGRHNLELDASPPQDVWGSHVRRKDSPGNFNTGSMGIGFIGTFTAENPRTAAINSANRLIAWRFHQRNIDPLSVAWIGAAGFTDLRTPRNITRIFGHLDVAYTGCPGYFFYDRVPHLIRQPVANLMGRMRSPFLLAPTGGEGWRRFNPNYPAYHSGIIWWHFPGVSAASHVRIDLSLNSGNTWQTIVPSTLNDGNHHWSVPSGGSTTTARLRVISLDHPPIQSQSISDFYLW
jgi:hypothetical protein